jgi:hypothetical protein
MKTQHNCDAESMEPVLPQNVAAEKWVLGAILLDNDLLKRVRQILDAEDFFFPQHATLFRVMLVLQHDRTPIDALTLHDRLKDQQILTDIGGMAYISALTDGLPRLSSIEFHARRVKENAQLREAIHAADAIKLSAFECGDPAEIQKRFRDIAERLQPANGQVRTVTAKDLCLMKVRSRTFLLDPVITSRSMGEIFSKRGVGKTFLAMAIAHAVGSGGKLFRFHSPEPAGVLYVDGELDDDTLQKRARQIGAADNEKLEFLCCDMLDEPFPHLASAKAQRLIEDRLEGKRLLVLDNLSALGPSTNESEAQDWMSIQSWLLNLRKNGIASIFLHHAGHAGHSRGTTRREDLLDWVCQLEHPRDYHADQGLRFELRFTKTRAYMGPAAHPLEVKFQQDMLGDDHVWTFAEVENARVPLILELRAINTSWRDIEKETGIPKSTAERLWREANKSPKNKTL